MTSTPDPVDAFAFYLPQFYPTPLNNVWWGAGFTEWNSLVNSVRGSRSPRDTVLTPGELGFYDLRSPETRARQGDIARAAGVGAFCVYHYYSAGERPIPEVVDALLRDGQPDFPFFLCWANHDWTKAWVNRPQDVIFRQAYDEHANDEHITWLLNAFRDPRYYRIGTAPVLAVYDPWSVPDATATFARWRELAERAGFSGLVLLGMSRDASRRLPGDGGMDAWIEDVLAPLRSVPAPRRVRAALTSPGGVRRLVRYGDYPISRRMVAELSEQVRAHSGNTLIPTVITSFNNTGRRQRRGSYLRPDPDQFADDLGRAVCAAPRVTAPDGGRRLLALNAWNEWGEVMTMEPTVEFGTAFLQAAARMLRGSGPI